jgi:hypothetical protein
MKPDCHVGAATARSRSDTGRVGAAVTRMEFFHLTFASEGRMPLFTTEPKRCAGLHALARSARGKLVLFCIVDEHVHVVLAVASRADAGHVGRALRRSLQNAAGVALGPAFIRPITTRSHAEWLARTYIIAQPKKHGLPDHPALYSGSCFQELVGARQLVDLRIEALLPRFDVRDVLTTVGLPRRLVEPLEPDAIRRLGVGRVLDASMSVLALAELTGRSRPSVSARRVAVQIADEVGIARSEIGHVMNLRPRSVRKIAALDTDVTVSRAVSIRLALEEQVAELRMRPSIDGDRGTDQALARASGRFVPNSGTR